MNKIVTLHVPPGYQEGDYVGRLFRGLQRNLTVPFLFECITKADYLGWWGKLSVFPPKERIVFLDLDTIITGNCDFLFDYDGPFCILRDFYRPKGYGSAIMSIKAGFGAKILEQFVADSKRIMKRLHGDQEWIEENVPEANLWQDLYPGKIKSYKADDLEAGPKGASIVCFHGQPRPHEMAHLGWMKEHWN